MKNSNNNTAYILGAGPVGLVTAWKLLENNWNVKIFEKNNIVGGMCRTWDWDGFLVDTGPHIFHTPDTKLAEFWTKHFSDLFIKGDFWCKNVRGVNFEEYWDYPLSWESISKYPRDLKKKIIFELNNRDIDKKAAATNYSEYMEAEVGPTLMEMFYKTYPEKIWGISTQDMTPEWAPKRVKFRNNITPFYHNEWNAVGKYGTGCIYERIKEKIIDLGGQINFNSEVKGLSSKNNRIKKIFFSNGLDIDISQNDKIISSLPITLTARLLGYNSNLSFRGIRSVYLSYDKKIILPKGIHWLYYGSEKIDFNRITEPKKLSKYISPTDKTYLTAEITYTKGDEIDSIKSDELIRRVARQIEEVGLIDENKLLNGSTNKEPYVYPLLYTGYQDDLSTTKSKIEKYEQLYSIGTGGDYNYADSQILFHKAFDLVSILTEKDSFYVQTIKDIQKKVLKKNITIKKKNIGNGYKSFIIAEAGLNHNGSMKIAKELINQAKITDCDAIKFQTYKNDSRISSKVKAANYAEIITGIEETPSEMFNRLALSFNQQEELFNYAKKVGIEMFSTPFDFESVDFLESMDVPVYKLSSMDLVNLPLIQYVAATGKPLILSTGMSTLGQIEEAIDTFSRQGNENLALLHCNSSYPAAAEEMNLKVINNLKNLFKIPVGLSDHTFGLFVSQAAITLGADIIERHFTLDRTFDGPDHILSSEPSEMKELVSIANKIPRILGDGIKKIKPNEYDTINSQRKCLYASRLIKKGEVIEREMISIKGPGGGLLPRYLDIVIGRVAKSDILSDYPITWNSI